MPLPGQNLIRYDGIFSSNSPLRAEVVASPEKVSEADQNRDPDGSPSPHINWAFLMKRTFGFDMDVCPKCKGPMKVISVIHDLNVIQKILKHIGHSTDPPDTSKRSWRDL